MPQRNHLKLLTLKIVGCICISGFIGAHAQKIFAKSASSLETSYLYSKDELEEYILEKGDSIQIRFKNRPRNGIKEEINKERSKSHNSYLETINDLKNYVLNTGNSLFLVLNNVKELTGNYQHRYLT